MLYVVGEVVLTAQNELALIKTPLIPFRINVMINCVEKKLCDQHKADKNIPRVHREQATEFTRGEDNRQSERDSEQVIIEHNLQFAGLASVDDKPHVELQR